VGTECRSGFKMAASAVDVTSEGPIGSQDFGGGPALR